MGSTDDIRQYFTEQDRFAAHSGIRLESIGSGEARAVMPITDYHLNGAGVVHGGAIFTLADFAFAAAANSSGKLALGVSTNITFLKPGKGSVLIAVAEEVGSSARLGTYQVRILNERGDLIALFVGTAFRKDTPLQKG